MARPYWKGFLKLSLVTCPITLTPATTEGEKVKFHTLNRKTGERIYTRYVDSVSGKTVEKDDQARAYEKGEDDYVVLEDEDLDAVQLESTRTVDIAQFAPADSVDWTFLDSPYFVVPDAEVSEEAFIIIREAMANEHVVGLASLVLGGRERAVMLQPWENGIVLWTLRFGDEVRDENEYWKEVEEAPVDKKMLSMIEQLIKDRTTKWSEAFVKDPVQDRLLDIIKSKKTHKGKPKPAEAEPVDTGGSNVIDLMAALKKSLEATPEKETGKSRRR